MCTLSGMSVYIYIYYVDLHDSAQGYNHNNICMQLHNVKSSLRHVYKCKFQVYTCTCAFVFVCVHVRVHLCVSTMLPKFTGFKAGIHNNVNMQP